MNVLVSTSDLTRFAGRISRLASSNLARTILASFLFLQVHSASAALSFGRGTPTTVGSVRYSSTPDSDIITGALTGPGTITTGLFIPANRIQYDIINSDQGPLHSWTLYYSPSIGPLIIGASTPVGYVDFLGTIVPEGGYAYSTLFNAGFGVYNYNVGAPWLIDYEPDHVTFIQAATAPGGLPANDGVGLVNPIPYLPSFGIDFDPGLGNGLVPASALVGNVNLNGQVYGPLPGNNCLSIVCTNLTVETCSNCVPVPFSATAFDTCCTNPVTLQYSPPSGTCLPTNTVTLVTVVAFDGCNSATNFFTVTVIPGPNCVPTNCISIFATNITAHTCTNCTTVPYNVFATDPCCPLAPPNLAYNPPPGTCFPVNSTTPVHVTAFDACGHTNTATFTVTVLPGPNCGNTNCISIYATNITALTCSNCTTVPYNVFATDTCCPVPATLTFNPPETTCFPANSTTTVTATAIDQCGNTATRFFTVTVLRDPHCPTNCISLYATNITAFTCSNCAVVPFNVYATDTCCPVPPTLTFNPPETTCFPVNTTTPVLVTAIDQCGHTNSSTFTVTVLRDPRCPTNCISLYATNLTAYTCTNCAFVPFSVFATDPCCAVPPTLTFNPPETTCFPVNTTTPVQVTAIDQCGNTNTATFTVTILPGLNCNPTNCISLYASNIVVHTCSNCTVVPYNVIAIDHCCTNAVSLVYNPPVSTCFPLNTVNPVHVFASDPCGNTAVGFFTVTVLPAAGCGGTNSGINMTGTSSLGGSVTNYYALWWNVTNAQLEAAPDLRNWQPVPGGTNSPYVVPATSPMSFFRLHYH